MADRSPELPRLREDLDFAPSPLADRPGLLIRDPHRYSEACIIVPPLLASTLALFDGRRTEDDLAAMLTGLLATAISAPAVEASAPAPLAPALARQLVEALSSSGFLDDACYRRLRDQRLLAFEQASERGPAHAGSGYPASADELSALLTEWIPGGARAASISTTAQPHPITGGGRDRSTLIGIAAPHATPSADPDSYAAAYAALGPEMASRTFVILGTSHYGAPNQFGLTRKPFQTPLGRASIAVDLVDALLDAAPDACQAEDYCHAIEHSIEFQVLFLQHRFGPNIRILPILCGPLLVSASDADHDGEDDGGAVLPESRRALASAFAGLGDIEARHGNQLCWVLGVDMAHLGARYGDAGRVQAHDATMNRVEERDRRRIDSIVEGDAARFWAQVHEGGADDLRWCGTAPIYTFLRVFPGVRARLLRYHQWNIDPASVVSFAALSFHHRA